MLTTPYKNVDKVHGVKGKSDKWLKELKKVIRKDKRNQGSIGKRKLIDNLLSTFQHIEVFEKSPNPLYAVAMTLGAQIEGNQEWWVSDGNE